MNDNGIDIPELKSTISNLKNKGKNIKFIYTIPDFHNPTGILTSDKIKTELCEIASSEDIFIVEDATFDPRPGQGAAFTKQVDLKAGDAFEGKPFPVL